MEKRIRGEGGKYVSKSTPKREVRSIRMTDEVWIRLNELAYSQKITAADLLEIWVTQSIVIHGEDPNLASITEILEEALTLKPNAGGAIKAKIRKALEEIRKAM